MTYIDLGAYNGDTVEQFINWGQLLGDISECKIYGFEPNYKFKPAWDDVIARQSQHVKSIEFIPKAAWIDNDGIILSEYENPTGSSVMDAKKDWDKGTKRKVPSIDFSDWLLQFAGEEIYIKIDIEGAEYPLLRKMIEDGTDLLCDLIFIEWHAEKMGDQYKKDQKYIEKNLKCRWEEWR